MNEGDVVRIADPRTNVHCWVMILKVANGRQFVGVMLVTARPHSDTTVILHPGDHPFISRPTSVDYGSAKPLVISKLEEWIGARRALPQEPLTAELLARVAAGLCQSSRTPNHVRELAGCESPS